MTMRKDALSSVEAEARKLLGDGAAEWMVRPSKVLDGMMPAELAISPEGAYVVLHELRRASEPLRVASQRKSGRGSAAPRRAKNDVV